MTAGPAWASPAEPSLSARLDAIDRALVLAADRLPAAEVARIRAAEKRWRERLGRSARHTVVALAGGTGSGKSSLFNAMVGVPLSPVGVRRPTTDEPIACVWGAAGPADPDAAALLDWVGISSRARLSRTTNLDSRPDPALEGLVLVDLPDHDTVRTEHVDAVEHVVGCADLVVWVVDPQKYADEALHGRYLSRLAGRDGALAVVMNQLDRVEPSTASSLGSDLRRLLAEDGLASVVVLAASAATGGGLPALRELLVERVNLRRQAMIRVEAELAAEVATVRALLGEAPAPVTAEEAGELISALTYAASGDSVVDRLLVEGTLHAPVLVSEGHAAQAVSRLVEPIFASSPPAWRRHGERLVDPSIVAGAVAVALSTVDASHLGPQGLRRLFMRRERADALRREAVRAAVAQAVSLAAAEAVLTPVGREIGMWSRLSAAVDAATPAG